MFKKLFFSCAIFISSFTYCAEPFYYSLPSDSVVSAVMAFCSHPNPHIQTTARYLSTMIGIFSRADKIPGDTIATHLSLYSEDVVKEANGDDTSIRNKTALEAQLRKTHGIVGAVEFVRLKRLDALAGQSSTVLNFDWNSTVGNYTTTAFLDFLPAEPGQIPLISRVTEVYAPRNENPVH